VAFGSSGGFWEQWWLVWEQWGLLVAVVALGAGWLLVAISDCETAVLGSKPAISQAYSGLPVLRWAAIWDGTPL
jgi:hypothetical protein